MSSPLPPAQADQRYVTVSPIAGGFITLSDHFFVHPADEGAERTVPSLSFLITHPGTSLHGSKDPNKPFHMMFDLGLRKAKERYPQVLQTHINGRAPYKLEPGVAAQLQSGGMDAAEIDLVLLSHVHYDHHGDPEDYPNASFLIGAGAMKVLKEGLGSVASHQHFEPDTLPGERSGELSHPTGGEWKPLGPFPAALDLFRDGSVFVVDMPGHLPGHVNLLCRMQDRWLMLCGDAFHDRRLLTGEKEIGTWEGTNGLLCIHVDKEVAAESIRRLRRFDEVTGEECELIAAHEEVWWQRNQGKAFPGRL